MIKPNAALRIPPQAPQTLHLLPRPPVPSCWPVPGLEPLTRDPAMLRVIKDAERVAGCDLPVLVLGESGVGKDVLVQYLHQVSHRAGKPLVAENCSAIPESLAESLLFGHVRGAFTGADRDRAGLFAQAEGGTLFLDEIGDMPASMQARLLRVLEERRVRPVGGQHSIPVDFRIVCATNRDLIELVREGRFRADLYYRLVGVTLRVPALRDRPGDIELLAARFLEELNETYRAQRRFARALIERMRSHAWPGNVRELRNRVAALYHLSGGEEIDGKLAESGCSETRLLTRVAPLCEIEKEAFRLALSVSGGDRNEVARLLGISRSTVYTRIHAFGL